VTDDIPDLYTFEFGEESLTQGVTITIFGIGANALPWRVTPAAAASSKQHQSAAL